MWGIQKEKRVFRLILSRYKAQIKNNNLYFKRI